jgi:peptidoglycan/LPS O-acetylase OafA/YrhL
MVDKLKPLDFRTNNFDLIRLAAALQVALVHGSEHLKISAEVMKWAIQILYIFPGVPIFFVVSGFLISASLERSPNVTSYARNRFLRIYPGLWTCFLVSIATVLVFHRGSIPPASFVPWAAAQLSFGQFYNPAFLRDYGVGVLNGSLWTITVELQFYALLPLLYFVLKRLGWRTDVLGGAFLALVLVNQCYAALLGGEKSLWIKLFGVTVLPYLYMFLLGILLQRNREFVARYLQDKAVLWLGAYVLLGMGLSKFGVPIGGNYLHPVCAIVLAFVTVSLAYSYSDRLTNLLRDTDISYGIYIYHMVVFNILVSMGATNRVSVFLLGLGIVVVLAVLSWTYVEKPAMRLKEYSVKVARGNTAVRCVP